MGRRRRQMGGWVVIGGLVLATFGAFAAPAWLRVTLDLVCLGAAVWWAVEDSRDRASGEALLRDLAGRAQDGRGDRSRLETATDKLLAVLAKRPVLTGLAADCTDLWQQAQSRATGLLEDAALVREDLAEIIAGVARVLSTEGAAVERHARGLASVLKESERKAANTGDGLAEFLADLDRHGEHLSTTAGEVHAAIERCLSELQTSRQAVIATAEALAIWRQPIAEIGQTVQSATDLAEQARILGVNASIEALRSGEAGRGFMLVAEEAERISGRLLRMGHQVASQIAESEQAAVKLGDQLAQVRGRLDRGCETGEEAVHMMDALGAPLPRFTPGVLPSVAAELFGNLSPQVRSLSDRLAGVFCQLDMPAAEEALAAAARLFETIAGLSTMLRTFAARVGEFEERLRAAEDTLAAATAAGHGLTEALDGRDRNPSAVGAEPSKGPDARPVSSRPPKSK